MQFTDTSTAYGDLLEECKMAIKDWVLCHLQHHSRRVANPSQLPLDQEKVSNKFVLGIQKHE